MKIRSFGKLSGSAGQSVVELALVLPLLLIMALGVVDFSRAILANNTIISLSREGANLALRTSIAPQDIMNSLASAAHPLTMATDGMMYLTEVKGVRNSNSIIVPTFQSQKAWEINPNGPGSLIDRNTAASCLGNIPVAEGESIYIFEVDYTYHSLFFTPYSLQLHSATIL